MSPGTGGPRHFHQELETLRSLLLEMSGLAETQVGLAVQSVLEQDVDRANQIIATDARVDDLELRIDRMAHELLALQQPLASDLRSITMTMKIANDLERVGDHAVNIAQAVQYLREIQPFGRIPEITEMARLAQGMLSDVLGAFVRRDVGAAREILDRDDQVDHLHTSMFRILLTHMLEDPRRIGPSLSILLISKNLERIADLATNIAEDLVFLVEGRSIRHGRGDPQSP
jgi:phosphate transport system protein